MFSFADPEPLYDVICPIRVLAQRQSHPEQYKLFTTLESHLGEWKKSEDFFVEHRFVSRYLIETLGMKDVDEELIFKIFGNFYTNDFTTNVGGTGGGLPMEMINIGLYHVPPPFQVSKFV